MSLKWILILFIIAIAPMECFATSNNTGYLDTPIIINESDEQKSENISHSITFTSEQEKHIQDIRDKKQKINSSSIRFSSGHSILKSPGINPNLDTDARYYVLQFYSPLNYLDLETHTEIEKSEIILEDYIPDNAFYAIIPSSEFENIRSLIDMGKIRYVGSIPPEAKVSQQFVSDIQENPIATYEIVVHLLEDPDEAQLKTLKKYMQIYSYSSVTHFAYGNIKGDNIFELLNLTIVKFIEPQIPIKLSTENIIFDNEFNNTYIVVFREWTPDNKEQVVSGEGVQYIRDTTFGEQEYPAIIISSNEGSIEGIKAYNFIRDVQPVIIEQVVVPPKNELAALPLIFTIIIFFICYQIKRGGLR